MVPTAPVMVCALVRVPVAVIGSRAAVVVVFMEAGSSWSWPVGAGQGWSMGD